MSSGVERKSCHQVVNLDEYREDRAGRLIEEAIEAELLWAAEEILGPFRCRQIEQEAMRIAEGGEQ